MPRRVFNAGLRTDRADESIRHAGTKPENDKTKDRKKDHGNGEANRKKRSPVSGGGRRKTRSDTQH